MPLTALPNELVLIIISYLDPLATQFLRSTNTLFRSLILPFEENFVWFQPYDSLQQMFFDTENSAYAIRYNLLSCTPCRRLLPTSHFTKAMIDGFHKDNSRHDPDNFHCRWRFCIPCGSQPLTWDNEGRNDYFKYLFRVRWEVDGVKFARCPRCEVVKAGKWEEWRRWEPVQMCDTCEPFDVEEAMAFAERHRRAERERWRVRGENRALGRG